MRRLALSEKKERGIPRKLRSLKLWSEHFKGYFPDLTDYDDRYLNWKIPVPLNLVEGRHSKDSDKALCAQYMLNACQYLIEAKPEGLGFCKVACVIMQPDMFSSEICIYLDEQYFNAHTCSGTQYDPSCILSDEKSLVKRWGLKLPQMLSERGIHVEYIDPEDETANYLSDHWYFFEKA